MADDSHNLYFGVIVRICFVIDSGRPNPDLAWPRPASEGAWSGGSLGKLQFTILRSLECSIVHGQGKGQHA